MSRHDEMDECIIGEMDQIQTIMQSSPHDPFSASHDAPSVSTVLHVLMFKVAGYNYTNMGHPFMTSTQSGRGVRLRWTHADGGGGHPMWTCTQKIRAH